MASEKKVDFYAREIDIMSSTKIERPLMLIMHNVAYFSLTSLDNSLTSGTISLLQEYRDVFLEELPP